MTAPIIWLVTRSNALSRRASLRGRRRTNFRIRKRLKPAIRITCGILSEWQVLKTHVSTGPRRIPTLQSNWDLVQSWSEQSRYRKHRPESAKALVEAVSDSRHGVIAWIKLYW